MEILDGKGGGQEGAIVLFAVLIHLGLHKTLDSAASSNLVLALKAYPTS